MAQSPASPTSFSDSDSRNSNLGLGGKKLRPGPTARGLRRETKDS